MWPLRKLCQTGQPTDEHKAHPHPTSKDTAIKESFNCMKCRKLDIFAVVVSYSLLVFAKIYLFRKIYTFLHRFCKTESIIIQFIDAEASLWPINFLRLILPFAPHNVRCMFKKTCLYYFRMNVLQGVQKKKCFFLKNF